MSDHELLKICVVILCSIYVMMSAHIGRHW
jgi:hypothetical protein